MNPDTIPIVKLVTINIKIEEPINETYRSVFGSRNLIKII